MPPLENPTQTMGDGESLATQPKSADDRGDRILTGAALTKSYARGQPQSTSNWLPWRNSPTTDHTTVTALEDVSIALHRGEMVGVAGPSGSGKSTLLHILAGLETPDSGQVQFEGTDIGALSPRERTTHRLHNVGLIFQRFHLLDALSARTNVALPLLELGIAKQERRTRAERVLKRVGLGDRIHHTPGQLSGGEQQRVAIARALVTEPAVVIADEPTGELDAAAGKQVLTELEEVAADRGVILASHDRTALGVADRIVRLRDGTRIKPNATSEESTDQPL